MPKLAVIIVTWNSMRHLPMALRSLASQTWRDFNVIVVDNASADGTVDCVRSEFPTATLLRNSKNLGFARANNQALAYVRAHLVKDNGDFFVLLMNDDAALAPDYLETLLSRVERRLEVGSATGLVYKAWVEGNDDTFEPNFSNIIDTAGLQGCRSRRVFDRGSGETDPTGRFSRSEEIFGVSGCLALYRWRALAGAEINGQWLDEDYFMYKEDVDLAWRLRLLGWSSWFIPEARAWHFRTAAGGTKQTVWGEVRRRHGRSPMIQCKSFRNFLLTIVKNEQGGNFWRDWPFILGQEILQVGYLTLFCPTALVRGVAEFFRQLPAAWRKRRLIMRRAKAKARDLRRWFRRPAAS